MSLPYDFFIAGGTLRAQTPSYVMRPADQELFEYTLAGELCYVLTPRQMGKSSLMIRTARRLAEAGRTVVILDLTGIGSGSADQWYLGLLEQIVRDLQLSIDVLSWWQERAFLTIPQRFSDFLRDIILQEIAGAIVIFIDEIDSTLKLDFRDDFFAALRAIYNARATESAYNRLTFALLGVATPTDLIKDRERTPFNIGRRIVLREFSYEEAESLKTGLEACHPGQAQLILRRILDWTNGYPYLTQKLCLAAAERPATHWDAKQIDELVEATFFSDAGRKDPNFKFIQQRIQDSSAAARRQMLNLYRKVYSGKSIPDDDRSQSQNYLELYGLVRVGSGKLNIRNNIYRQIFDQKWIEATMPANRDLRLAIVASLAALLVIVAVVVKIAQSPSPSTSLYIKQFNDNAFPTARLEALAGLFRLNDDQEGLTLFYNLDPYDQLDLFNQESARSRSQEMVMAIRRISLTMEAQDPNDQAIMGEMITAIRAANVSGSDKLIEEIRNWKIGRELADKQQYQAAISAYSITIEQNPDNPAARYDRASALVALGKYAEALSDLDRIVGIAIAIPATPTPIILPTNTTIALTTDTSGLVSSPISLSTLTPTITALANGQLTAIARASDPTIGPRITATVVLPREIGERGGPRLHFINRERIIESVVGMIKANLPLFNTLSIDTNPYPRLATLATQLGLPLSASGSVPQVGKLVYEDDFKDRGVESGLEDLVNDPIFQRGFHPDKGQVYHLKTLRAPDTRAVFFARQLFTNFTQQIEMWDFSDTFVGKVFQGVTFRGRDANHYYAFMVDPRGGRYAVRKRAGPDTWVDLIPWKDSGAVKRNQDHNFVRVDGSGKSFTLYLNGQQVDTFSDEEYASGMLGMIVENQDASDPHMHFDNYRVWSDDPTPEGSQLPATRDTPTDQMSLVRGGEYIMGANNESDGQPSVVDVPDFYIDRHEVTNAAYGECIAAKKCEPQDDESSELHPNYAKQKDFANYPVIHVSWEQATNFCGWAGKRLPTEAEWEKAASWDSTLRKKTAWPWGNTPDDAKLNSSESNLQDAAPVDKYEAAANGLFQMSGNVWEWTSSIYKPYPYAAGDGRENAKADDDRVYRGGSWHQSAGRARVTYRQASPPDRGDREIGFRCAASP